MRRIALIALVVATAAGATALAYASESPKSFLAAMRHAARSERSVHYVTMSSSPGHRIRMVCDVGPHSGIQRITVTSGGHSGPATALVSGGTAYIRGDAFTMRVYFGFTQTQATKYAGQWISIPSSSPGFATVSADATFPSFLSTLFPQTKLSLVKSGNLLGVHGTAVQEGITIAETVLAPAHGKPLPVRETATSPGHPGKGTTTMSDWGKVVHISAPANAVPIATVAAG